MHFTAITTLFLGLVVQVVTSWHIPKDTIDGVYSVEILTNGTEKHTRISDLTSAISQRRHQREFLARGVSTATNTTTTTTNHWAFTCLAREELPDNVDLDHRQCDEANDALDAQCRHGAAVRNGLNFYSISGCVVAYYCHHYSRSTTRDSFCYEETRKDTSLLITGECGWYKPGGVTRSVFFPPLIGLPLQYYSESYGYENLCSQRGQNFCGTGI